jgi:hypothetical protein
MQPKRQLRRLGLPAVICSLVPYVPFGSRTNESEVAPDS